MSFGFKSILSTTRGATNGFLNEGDTIFFRADFDTTSPLSITPIKGIDESKNGLELKIGDRTVEAAVAGIDSKGVTFSYTLTAKDNGAISVGNLSLAYQVVTNTGESLNTSGGVKWAETLIADNSIPKAPTATLVPETVAYTDPTTGAVSKVPTGKFTEIQISDVPTNCSWRFSLDGGKTWTDGVLDRIKLSPDQTCDADSVLIQSVNAAGNHSESASISLNGPTHASGNPITLVDHGLGGVMEGQQAHFVVDLPTFTGPAKTRIEVLGADGKPSEDAYFWNDRTKITDQDGHFLTLYYGNIAILNPSIKQLHITVDTIADTKLEGTETATLHIKDFSGGTNFDAYGTFNIFDVKPITSTLTQITGLDGVSEGDSVIFKLQFSRALAAQSWTQFTLSDDKRGSLWNDDYQYSFDGGNTWGGQTVFYGNWLSLAKGTESVLIKVAGKYDADSNNNVVSLNVKDGWDTFVAPESKSYLIHDNYSPKATLSYVPDEDGKITAGENAIFKLQFSESLKALSWTQFTLSDNEHATLWNDSAQFSYDGGKTWGGKLVYYGNYLELDKGLDSLLIKVATKVDPDRANHSVTLNVTDNSGAFNAPASLAFTIYDNPPQVVVPQSAVLG